jgi:GNAT superfamily N-acetyltransferase
MQRARAVGRRAQLNNGDTMIKMRLKNRNDNERIETYLINNWGGNFIVVKGKRYYCCDLQGVFAEGDSSILGICLYTIDDDELQIAMIESFNENKGIGSLLIKEIESIANESNIKRIWLIATNDNINAMRFYIKRGFSFRRIDRNSIEEYRKIKPGIPIIGHYGIPIIDELEFEKIL